MLLNVFDKHSFQSGITYIFVERFMNIWLTENKIKACSQAHQL